MRHAYRGWKSTKLHLALIVMGLMTAVYALAGFPPAAFGEFCFGLVSAAGVYSGAHAAEKFAKPPVQPPPSEG